MNRAEEGDIKLNVSHNIGGSGGLRREKERETGREGEREGEKEKGGKWAAESR